MKKILFVDDNPDILEANRSYFAEHGFATTAVGCGKAAVAALKNSAFDCVVLDVMMPGMDGYAVCQVIRKQSGVPVIFLSCLDRPDDKIQGLMLGGDVYMTKPYDLRELHAQVMACLRRCDRQPEVLPGFYIDRKQRLILFQHKSVLLSHKEMALLILLLDHPDTLLGKRQINQLLWPNGDTDENRLHALVKKLRQKTAFAQQQLGVIESVYGSGYRLNTSGRMEE